MKVNQGRIRSSFACHKTFCVHECVHVCLLGYRSLYYMSEYVSSALLEKEPDSGRQSGGGMLPCVRSVNVTAGSRDWAVALMSCASLCTAQIELHCTQLIPHWDGSGDRVRSRFPVQKNKSLCSLRDWCFYDTLFSHEPHFHQNYPEQLIPGTFFKGPFGSPDLCCLHFHRGLQYRED